MNDEIIRRAVEAALGRMLPEFVTAVAAEVKRQLDTALAGEQIYHRKRPKVDDQIVAQFNGRNAEEVARAVGVSRRTVYRAIARRRDTMGRDK